ncbi:MAG: RagB/SusD family nutrient uptake outer membrane protein [Cyclobacteriaceae bacterium]
MRRFKILTLIVIGFGLFSSCEDEFLSESNPNTITTDSFWQSEEDFQKGLITVYGALQYSNVTGANTSQFENIRSDVGRSFDFYGFAYSFSQLDWNISTAYVRDRWEELYVGVFRANQVINKLADYEADADFTEAEKTQVLAQARFLRGLYYFWIVNSYGQAVLRTEVPADDADLHIGLSSRAEVIESVVIPDLEFAMANLPTGWTDTETGRATWGAATSLLGKVYLYDEEWELAADHFKQVIDSDIYSLTSDIGENFTTWGEFNSESIFEVSYNAIVNEGVSAHSKEDVGNTQGAEATYKAKNAAPQLRGGWRVVVPTHIVNELYENDEVDPDNGINDVNRYSRRAYWSIAFLRQDDGPLGHYYQQSGDLREIADWFNGGAESCYWKKGTSWYNASNEGQLQRSGINERIIRLADVYLMYAEAILNAQGDGAIDEAITYIDLVRARAGVRTLDYYRGRFNGQIPQLHKRGIIGKHPFVALNASNLLNHLKYVERVLELSFEGVAIRWNDLVRWGIVREAFQNQNEHKYTEDVLNPETGLMEPLANNVLEFCGEICVEPEPFFLGRAIARYQSADVQLEVYAPETHDYFPIPVNETNSNSSID